MYSNQISNKCKSYVNNRNVDVVSRQSYYYPGFVCWLVELISNAEESSIIHYLVIEKEMPFTKLNYNISVEN